MNELKKYIEEMKATSVVTSNKITRMQDALEQAEVIINHLEDIDIDMTASEETMAKLKEENERLLQANKELVDSMKEEPKKVDKETFTVVKVERRRKGDLISIITKTAESIADAKQIAQEDYDDSDENDGDKIIWETTYHGVEHWGRNDDEDIEYLVS